MTRISLSLDEELRAGHGWHGFEAENTGLKESLFGKQVDAVFNQSAFRGRNDDGDETTATWMANENTNWTQLVDTNFRIRIEVEETATAAGTWAWVLCAFDSFGGAQTVCCLQYNLNSAGWNTIAADGSGTVVKLVGSTQFTGPVVCTNQLTTSTRTNVAGRLVELTGGTNGASLSPSNISYETEWVLQIVGAGVSNNDTLQLRQVSWNGTAASGTVNALNTYTNTPSITVSKGAAATPDGLWDDSVDCAFAIVDF